MVNTRLHLICGNCGSNDDWEWTFVPDWNNGYSGNGGDDVFIICMNCSTIHSLNNNAINAEKGR